MRLLVLGGSNFVGRTVVTAAVGHGWEVTTFSRGRAQWRHPGARHMLGDRTGPDLAELRTGHWDAVVDTWAGAPRVVRDSAAALADGIDRYVFVSSRAVYAQPLPRGLDESHPTVNGSPDADAAFYGVDKRGGERAVLGAVGDRAILARAGLILGPHEDVGRLPFWLHRVAGGGRILAPGPADLPWRFIDVRDLAEWILTAIAAGRSGPYNLVAPLGHATMGSMFSEMVEVTGSDAEAVWIDHDAIERAGIVRYDAFPGWVPPEEELEGLIWTDVFRATEAGLACRPSIETVADTWTWVQSAGGVIPRHPDHPHALDSALESRLIASLLSD